MSADFEVVLKTVTSQAFPTAAQAVSAAHQMLEPWPHKTYWPSHPHHCSLLVSKVQETGEVNLERICVVVSSGRSP